MYCDEMIEAYVGEKNTHVILFFIDVQLKVRGGDCQSGESCRVGGMSFQMQRRMEGRDGGSVSGEGMRRRSQKMGLEIFSKQGVVVSADGSGRREDR